MNNANAIDNEKMRPLFWSFDCGQNFAGYTDGTYWNGWSNVWVDAETHPIVIEFLRSIDTDLETVEEFENMEPDPDGLFSYSHGFCTRECQRMTAGINRRGETAGFDSQEFPVFEQARDWLLSRVDEINERGILALAVKLREIDDDAVPFEMATEAGTVFYIEPISY